MSPSLKSLQKSGSFAIANLPSFCKQKLAGKNANLVSNRRLRHYATINQLICLSNLENLNAVFIQKGMEQSERLTELNKIAIQQMKVLEAVEDRKLLK